MSLFRNFRSKTDAAAKDRKELRDLLTRAETLAMQIAREEVNCRRTNKESYPRLQLIEELEQVKTIYDQQAVMFNLMHG